MFLIIFYLILVFIYITFSKPKKRVSLVKNKGKINAFKGQVKDKLFCSKFSLEYKYFKKIESSQFEFEKESLFDSYNTALQRSGVDFRVPIFKVEFYNKSSFEDLIRSLSSFRNLENKGVNLNLFVFVDNYEKLKKVSKILNIFSFKGCLVRAYHCLEIDYKLLGAINFFNLNKEEVIRPKIEKFEQKQISRKENKNEKIINFNVRKRQDCTQDCEKMVANKKESIDFDLIFSKTKQNILKNFSGLFIEEFDQVYKVENLVYKNLFEIKTIKSANVEIEVKRCFDYENNAQFYAIKLQNISNKIASLKICFGNVFDKLNTKNTVYVSDCKSDKFNITLKSLNKALCFCGEGFQKKISSNFMGVFKNIKLLPHEKTEIYFVKFLDLRKFKNFNIKDLSIFSIEEIASKYKNIALPKVFSQNKSINDLINNYLPQKIFEYTITNASADNLDFIMLKNLIFDAKIVNKDFVSGKLSNIYLLRQNLFSVYQNLLYFYFGIFPNELGANINVDKSLVLKDATTSFEVAGKRVVVRFKDLGLKNEVEINNIKYSNLKFLTFNNCSQGDVEVLY